MFRTVTAPLSTADSTPVLIVPYMWIGDFVRCHTVVRMLRSRWPSRPIDVLTTSRCAPLLDYMPGVRKGIVWDLPRSRLALRAQGKLADLLRAEKYGTALVMPRTWKSALAPYFARIPERIGFVGEGRFGLLNDWRWGERKLPRMVDRCAALALPAGAARPPNWPEPELRVPATTVDAWRRRQELSGSLPVAALAPGAVGPSKRWQAASYVEVARELGRDGMAVWVLGGPDERDLANQIVTEAGDHVRDLTGPDLRNAILALAAADLAISNDSGLLHIAAALGTPTIGIFGPTSPWHWAPLNPLAAVIETKIDLPCRPCHKPVCRVRHHRCMRDITAAEVLNAAHRVMAPLVPRTPA